jgi:PAS domain S-box-containing protein
MPAFLRFDERCRDCLLFGVIQGMEEGLVLVDREGRIVHLNRSAEQRLGTPAPALIGQPIGSYLKARHPALARVWSSASRDPLAATSDLSFSDGAALRVSASLCRSDAGEPIGRVLILRDVTRERRIQIELPAAVARKLVEMSGPPEEADQDSPLTRREREVVALLAEGLSNAAIAERLGVTLNTVASHLKNLYPKIGATGRAQAAAYAVTHGIRPRSR